MGAWAAWPWGARGSGAVGGLRPGTEAGMNRGEPSGSSLPWARAQQNRSVHEQTSRVCEQGCAGGNTLHPSSAC